MTEAEAAQIVMAIGENWGVQISELGMELWFNTALRNTDVEDAGPILMSLADTMTRVPKPADWNAARRARLRPDGAIGAARAEAARDRGLPEPELSKADRLENVRKIREQIDKIAAGRKDLAGDTKKRRSDYR